MAYSYGSSVEKVTFNIHTELKESVLALKDELKVSLSTIYNEAIAEYIERKELDRWHKGAEKALHDDAYMQICEELGSDSGDIHEY